MAERGQHEGASVHSVADSMLFRSSFGDDAVAQLQQDFSQRSCWTGPVIVAVSTWCRGLGLLTLI